MSEIDKKIEIVIKDDYTGKDIQALEGLEAVRKRPGMYISSTGLVGLHHLVWEIVDNAIDEALAGVCDEIVVSILPNNAIYVSDNGRGIPVDIHEKLKVSSAQVIFTQLHAGGKFGGGAYKVAGGLHGVGATVVNFLSETLSVRIFKGGKEYFQEYYKGKPQYPLKEVGQSDKHGTIVIFKPDPEIFTETLEYDYNALRDRLQQCAFLNKGLRITVRDERNEENTKENIFQYEGGIIEYVQFLNKGKELVDDKIIYCSGVKVEKITNDIDYTIELEIAMQYTTDDKPREIYSFVNNIKTFDGGTHNDGFGASLTKTMNDYAKAIASQTVAKNKKSTKNKKVTSTDVGDFVGDDVREGLTVVMACRHPNPQFASQTKGKLGNPEVRKVASQVLKEGLDTFLQENPQSAKKIIEQITIAAQARKFAEQQRDLAKKNMFSFRSKLTDCTSKNSEECEMFIVEGDSAGGAAKKGRDSKYQAIMPLRGKIINIDKANKHKILLNNEVQSLIHALKTGYGDEFNIKNLRYHKIIIMTDADVDGAHIRTLLLTFFYRFMRSLVENGHIYLAQPPLYRISSGKRAEYAYTEEEKTKIASTFPKTASIQRYKGLGEMNADQLSDTTMDKNRRVLLKVSLEMAADIDSVFDMLMGQDVTLRKEFIEENASYVKNLDI